MATQSSSSRKFIEELFDFPKPRKFQELFDFPKPRKSFTFFDTMTTTATTGTTKGR